MGVQFEMSGFDQLQERLTDMGRAGERSINLALREGGEVIAQDAIRRVNLGPGRWGYHLRDEIKVLKVRTNKDGFREVSVGVEHPVNGPGFYGRFLEYGSKHQVARPFLRPAFEASKEEARDIVFTNVKRELRLK